jgi:hypothetical protein
MMEPDIREGTAAGRAERFGSAKASVADPVQQVPGAHEFESGSAIPRQPND